MRGIFAAFSFIKKRRAGQHTLILRKRSSKLAALLTDFSLKRFLWTASFVSLFCWLKPRISNLRLKPKFLIQTACTDCKQLRYQIYTRNENWLTDWLTVLTDWRNHPLIDGMTDLLRTEASIFNDKICVRKKNSPRKIHRSAILNVCEHANRPTHFHR